MLHESWRVEDWEIKQVEDKEAFASETELGESREALQNLLNHGESDATVRLYKEEVRKMLGLPETIAVAQTIN